MFAVGPQRPHPAGELRSARRAAHLAGIVARLSPTRTFSGAPDFLERDDGLSARLLGRDLIRARREDRANRD
ncbi:hypothetical protein FQA47_014016 [Oryzias melastigma]|uniref:Uncharacterized protein n=1 Tax=Oryzias melastigma TaxID=30732 RepID=A0A834F3P6_ORYME|nr:hypothetical protein FQA47_014016 [Oryzias melastigma]